MLLLLLLQKNLVQSAALPISSDLIKWQKSMTPRYAA
jgi:hypothetical protein